MLLPYSYPQFYTELQTKLPTSSGALRKVWATLIVNNAVDVKDLSRLLRADKKIALRFAWLLSDIGELDARSLFTALPFLLEQSAEIDHFNFIESFANYWLISGVPPENESEAIELLFQWVSSGQVNVTTKSRSLKVLVYLADKYPELKNEISLCVQNQLGKHTSDFDKKANKVLTLLKSR